MKCLSCLASAQESTPSAQESADSRRNEAAPFRVIGPGWYRQRDGGKAEVLAANGDMWIVRDAEGDLFRLYGSDGHRWGPNTTQPWDLVAPWVEPVVEPEPESEPEPEFDVVEREIAYIELDAGGWSVGNATWHDMHDAWPKNQRHARATVQFRIPRPAKPKVTASVSKPKEPKPRDYLSVIVDADGGLPKTQRYITREQAIALRDALNAAKLEGK